MNTRKFSGQNPYVFTHRPDLDVIPSSAQEFVVNLHGGFSIDLRPGFGQVYFGMPGCGILRVDADLKKQSIINLPDELKPLNFHSTKIGEFDGKRRLFLAANDGEKVAVLSLEGDLEFVLPRPLFNEYQGTDTPYHPTDTVLVGKQLFIADGYGSNYISLVDVETRKWTGIFGGRTDDPFVNGKFSTAHGINLNPHHHHLDIADRPLARLQAHAEDGRFLESHKFPAGSFLCGINYLEINGHWVGVIGCLLDPIEGRPAPIYIFDAENYELLSVIRPKEELGIELAQHIHNVILHKYQDQIYLVCQAWNPGDYFVLQMV
jgi:hypothetical protein